MKWFHNVFMDFIGAHAFHVKIFDLYPFYYFTGLQIIVTMYYRY